MDASIFLNYSFVQIYPKEQDCWIMWQFYLQFLRNLQTVFHSGCINLLPTNNVGEFLFLHTYSHICSLQIFLIIAIPVVMRWYVILVSMLISLIISHVEHLFMFFSCHLFVFFGEMSAQVFCEFLDWVFLLLLLSCVSYVHILKLNSCQQHHLQTFSPSSQTVFSFCLWFPFLYKSLIQSNLFLLLFLLPWEVDLRKHSYDLLSMCYQCSGGVEN